MNDHVLAWTLILTIAFSASAIAICLNEINRTLINIRTELTELRYTVFRIKAEGIATDAED